MSYTIKLKKLNVIFNTKYRWFTLFNDNKIEIIGIHNNINLYEQSTINLLYEHFLIEDFNVLYLHTKCVKHNNTNIGVTDWVKYLSYFNIY